MGLQLSDEAIVRRIQEGDTAMFRVLVQRYSTCLLNYIHRLSGNKTDAEDLLQDVFVRVFNHLGTYDSKRPFRPWVYKVTTNLCYDFLKKRKSDLSLDQALSAGDDPGDASLMDLIPDEQYDPEKLAMRREFRAALEERIETLPHKQKEVFVLFHFEHFAYKEIADTLAVPIGTVKSRLHNACKRVFLDWEGGLPA